METKYQTFEDLIIWQESIRLCCDVFDSLGSSKHFGLINQIEKSAVSVPSNIAEGFERQTDKEFIQFLYIAKGSSAELRTQLYIASNQKIIDQEKCSDFINRSKKNSALIQNLISSKKRKLRNNLLAILTQLTHFFLLANI
ncbi:MAG: four helix bundle protein [Saprospiraceae bacterium]